MAHTKSSIVFCMLLVLTLFIQDFAECSSRRGAGMPGILQHKLSLEIKKMALRNGAHKLPNNGNDEMPEDWQLRRVPAGPDPLHHNGQDPTRPRTP